MTTPPRPSSAPPSRPRKGAGVTVDAIAHRQRQSRRAELAHAPDAAATCSRPTTPPQASPPCIAQIAAEIRNTYRLQYTSHADGRRAAQGEPQGLRPGHRADRPDGPRGRDRRGRRHHLHDQQAQLAGFALAIVIGLLVLAVVLFAGARAARDGARAPPRPLHDGRARARSRSASAASRCATSSIARGERSFGGSAYFKHVGRPARAGGHADARRRVRRHPGWARSLVLLLVVLRRRPRLILYAVVFAAIAGGMPEFVVRRRPTRAASASRISSATRSSPSPHRCAPASRSSRPCRRSRWTGPSPIAKEFQRVETETRLGRSADEALQSMAERLRLEELRVRRARRQHPAPGRRLALRDPRHGRGHGARSRAVRTQGAGADRDGPRLGVRAGRHAVRAGPR